MNFKNIIINLLGYGNSLKLKHMLKPPKISEIIVDISASCNAECPFCPRVFMPAERAKGFMSLDLFDSILKDAKKNGITNLRLYSTAEPTLHPKFDQIIKLAKSNNFTISISTNASTLHKHLESLLSVDLLQLSIEGWDKESYEKYRYPLKFDQTYENIKIFHEHAAKALKKPKISTNLLLTKETDIQKYTNLWSEFVDEINIHFMYDPVKYESGKFIAKKLDTEDEYYNLDRQKNDFYCDYPFSISTIAFDGKIALCCDDFAAELNIGNIQDLKIKELFNSKKFNLIRKQFYSQKLDLCKECSRFSKPQDKDIKLIKNKINILDNNIKKKINFNY